MGTHLRSRLRFGSSLDRSLTLAAQCSMLWDIMSGALGELEARWTIGNFGHGMPCPYISRLPTDLSGRSMLPSALARNVSLFMKWGT